MKRPKTLFLKLVLPAAVLVALARPASAAPPGPETRVVVVGGGLAGLVAAYELQNKGITAHVLDAAERWGGRVATVEYADGLRSEFGMHEIWDSNPLLAYVKKFNIKLSEPEEPYSSVVLNGKYHPHAQSSADQFLATLFSKEEIKAYRKWLKSAQELYDESEAKGLTPRLAEIQKLSFAQWVESAKLSPAVSEFIRLSVECEVATDWTNISAVYGLQQLSIFMHDSEQCRHVADGNQRIIEAFVDAFKGPKTLGALVTRIVRTKKADGSTEVVVHYKKDNVMRSMRAEKVVVAVPYHVLHAIQFEPGLTDQQSKAVESLIPGLYTVVHFIIDAKAADKLMVNGKIPFPVLTRGPLGVVYGFLEEPPASQEKMVFTLLIHGDYTRSYLQPRDAIRKQLLAELDNIWPAFSSSVKETHFYGYHPAATPGWGPGRSPLDSLHASLRIENVGLFLAGDYIYSSHAEGAVKSGQDAARKIAEQLKGTQ